MNDPRMNRHCRNGQLILVLCAPADMCRRDTNNDTTSRFSGLRERDTLSSLDWGQSLLIRSRPIFNCAMSTEGLRSILASAPTILKDNGPEQNLVHCSIQRLSEGKLGAWQRFANFSGVYHLWRGKDKTLFSVNFVFRTIYVYWSSDAEVDKGCLFYSWELSVL